MSDSVGGAPAEESGRPPGDNVTPDALRLAVGTLTVLRVLPPRVVDRRTAGAAVLLAPLAVVPLGLAVGLTLLVGRWAGLTPLVVGLLGVGVLVLGNRAFHVDGLSDTADGLSASYEPERSLAAMKSGTSGPAGGVAVLLALGLQAAAMASVLGAGRGPVLVGVLVCVSRCALLLTCARGVPAARTDGLGEPFTGSVRPVAAAASWAVAALVTVLVAAWAGWGVGRAVVAVLLAVGLVLLLVRHTVRRFGGVTGDVFGAAIELALAALLVVLSGPVAHGLLG